jgi:hypothetical protein
MLSSLPHTHRTKRRRRVAVLLDVLLAAHWVIDDEKGVSAKLAPQTSSMAAGRLWLPIWAESRLAPRTSVKVLLRVCSDM